ncbi:hypothetical protein A6R68_20320, partial [Neotoma lepida]
MSTTEEREPYIGNDKCGDIENMKVMCRPPPNEQWTQLLGTQGLILFKYKFPNLDGSLSSLLAFLWNCGRVSTSGQPTIEPVPPIVAEGGSVLLLIHNLPENLEVFIWFKGINVLWSHEVARYKMNEKLSIHGPAYSGRETLNSDGSLLLHNVTRKDAGLYTLRILCRDLKSEESHVLLRVN